MKINLLHILMVLVAMQSTIAVADLHQAHQTGQEHISFNHSDDISNHTNLEQETYKQTQSNIETEIDVMVSYDCHHCCHCHGVACHYLFKDDVFFAFFPHTDSVIESYNLYTTRIISPNLRPPIV